MSPYKPRREIIAEIKAQQEADKELQQKQEEVKEKLLNRWFNFKTELGKIRERLYHLYEKARPSLHYVLKLFSWGYFFTCDIGKSTVRFIPYVLTMIMAPVGRLCLSAFSLAEKATGKILWSIRWYVMVGFTIFLVVANVQATQDRYPEQPLKQAIQNLNNWPLLPSSTLALAQQSFDLGYEEMALDYLERTEDQISLWRYILGQSWLNDELKKTKAKLEAPGRTSARLEKVNALLEKTPYSWQLLLEKARLEIELYHQANSQKTLELISWLYPTLSHQAYNELQKEGSEQFQTPLSHND